MSNQLRDISVEKEIYCEMFEVEPTGVSDQLIHAFFERHAAEHLELLKAGYQQMAGLPRILRPARRLVKNTYLTC